MGHLPNFSDLEWNLGYVIAVWLKGRLFAKYVMFCYVASELYCVCLFMASIEAGGLE